MSLVWHLVLLTYPTRSKGTWQHGIREEEKVNESGQRETEKYKESENLKNKYNNF